MAKAPAPSEQKSTNTVEGTDGKTTQKLPADVKAGDVIVVKDDADGTIKYTATADAFKSVIQYEDYYVPVLHPSDPPQEVLLALKG